MFKFSSAAAALAVSALLVGTVSAQEQIPLTGPIKYVRYDMATGTSQVFDTDPGPKTGPGDSNPVVLWSNANIGGSFSTGSGNAIVTNHHMGWGVATFGGMGAVITEFRMAYATSILASEGTVDFHMKIYDGALGFGNQGTVNPNGDLIITGLPNSAGGGFEGYIVDVTLGTPITLADGPFGYSYNSDASFTLPPNKVTGPLLCIAPAGPGVINAYDRYLESTNAYVNTFSFAAPNVANFCMRLTGRANGAPPPAWVNYGTKSGVTFEGTGSATPGSVDNNLKIKSTNGKKAVLLAGITQSNIMGTSLGLTFYAFPYLIEIVDLQLGSVDGTLNLPVALPLELMPGDKIYMQAFAQSASNQYTKYSDGIELTIQ